VKISLSSVERQYSLRFRTGQALAATVGTGALFGSAFLTAHILNSEAYSNAEQVLRHGLADIGYRVALAVENDHMKHEISNNLEDFESWASQNGPRFFGPDHYLDAVQIFDAAGEEIARFPLDDRSPSLSNRLPASTAQSGENSKAPQSIFTVLNGQFAAYNVASLSDHPTLGTALDHTIVGVSYVSDQDLDELAQLIEVPTIEFELPDSPLAETSRSSAIGGHAGEEVARLTWPDIQPGTEVLKRLVPYYLGVCAVMTFLSIFMGRWYRQLIQSILTERERVKKAAETDSLTGLLNRAGITSLVETTEIQDALNKGTCALLYLDVNGFKRLNDSMGHGCGDKALNLLAQRLTGACRKGDIIARLGGDEFMALIIDEYPEKAARKVCSRLRERASVPVKINDDYIVVGAAMGVAISEPDLSWSDLLLRADAAMYRAKQDNGIVEIFFSDELKGERERERAIEDRLRKGLQGIGTPQNPFDVVFQPVVDSRGRRMAYAEALLRWNDQVLGPVPPSEFIPIAESRGLVPELGRFVIERCCDALAELPWLRVSINVSPLQLVQPNFPDQMLEAVRKRSLDASRIIVEITENALIEVPDTARQRIELLSAAGFLFALDDFGTGFASISYLRQFPFSTLKIDRSFVVSLGKDRSSNLLFESMVRLGEGFRLEVVSEGVETAIQSEMIARTGCHFQQGFLHARPMSLAALENFHAQISEQRDSA